MSWDERFGYDRCPEVIRRTHDGKLELVDSASDDAEIRDYIRNHRPEMRFRLTYDGLLKASGNQSNRPKEKWAIRRDIRPQLAELWSYHPALRGHQMAYTGSWDKVRAKLAGEEQALSDKDAIEVNRARLAKPIE